MVAPYCTVLHLYSIIFCMAKCCTCGCGKFLNSLFSLKIGSNYIKPVVNAFISKIEYADNHHIWKPLRYLAFSACKQNARGQNIFLVKTMCIAENYLKNCIGFYFELSDLVLSLWRNLNGKYFILSKFKLIQGSFLHNASIKSLHSKQDPLQFSSSFQLCTQFLTKKIF